MGLDDYNIVRPKANTQEVNKMADENETKTEDDVVGKVIGAAGGATLGYTVGAAVVGTVLTTIGVVTAPAWIPAALAVGFGYGGYKWMKGK